MPTAVYRVADFDTFELDYALDLPDEGATVNVTSGDAGSLTYLAGHIILDQGSFAAYRADEDAHHSDRFVLIDGIYVRVWGWSVTPTGGRLDVNQSWETEWAPEGETPIPLRLVEPSPPITPVPPDGWYFPDCARAYADATA